jgi:homoserine O-acetyltransferase
MEWAVEEPELFEYIFPIATNAFHSPWGIAFNASQRLCIESDATWKTNDPKAGMLGMKVARSVALISYRNYDTYLHSQSESDNKKLKSFRSDSYQRYQGEKLAKRFNAFSYYTLSQSMDSHNVGRGRGSAEQALKCVLAKTLVMGIKSDILFPPQEQQFIAAHIPGGEFKLLNSLYGHDGFLLEYKQISKFITSFITKHKAAGNLPVKTMKYHI